MFSPKAKSRATVTLACLSNDKEIRDQQAILLLMLHSRACNEECGVEDCWLMKRRLSHVKSCGGAANCRNKSYCSAYFALIRHWARCKDLQCLFCAPLKRELSLEARKLKGCRKNGNFRLEDKNS
ncbi:unnamed protein product [Rodentolepis nana]|uniref:TAZ-type domain-containing protein n=1 Tax=Rodentolepis nana TaxID=102285 RepID=A0A0R3TBN6_RODNA|nr:unnamed protein product [Rodentolepis nana]